MAIRGYTAHCFGLVALTILFTTGCGSNSLTGSWRDANADPLSLESMEFRDNGSAVLCSFDGELTEYEWRMKGDELILSQPGKADRKEQIIRLARKKLTLSHENGEKHFLRVRDSQVEGLQNREELDAILPRLGGTIAKQPSWDLQSQVLQLTLDGTRVTGRRLAQLQLDRTLPQLESLVIKHGVLDQTAVDQLASLGKLKELHIEQAVVTGDLFTGLRGLGIRSLSLVKTKTDFAGIDQLNSVERLVISYCSGDEALRTIPGISGLRSLELRRSSVTDKGLVHLESLQNLHTLSLEGTRISNAGIEHLQKLPALRVLNLSYTDVGDAALEHLRPLSRLEHLDLRKTKATYEGLEVFLKQMPSLSEDHVLTD